MNTQRCWHHDYFGGWHMADGTLTLQKLESHLWGAANILRGRIDSSDYKHYVFGLLFYKRLCDVWEEEYEDRLKEYGDKDLAADPDEHRFHIPERAFWRDVREKTTNIGEHLNNAFHAIEDANMRLIGPGILSPGGLSVW